MRTKRALKNLFFNLLQQFSLILSNFIMQPILVSRFGSSINGLVSTIKQLMSYVQLTGAGISSASTFAMYKPVADNDYKKLSGIYTATAKMFFKAGNVFTIITLIVAIIYPFTIKSNLNYFMIFGLIIVMSVCGASEFYASGKLRSILIANQDNYIVDISQIIGNVSTILILILLVSLKQNIVIVELGISITYILRILFMYVYVSKKYIYLDLSIKPLFSEINQRGDAVVHQISGLVVMGSSTLIISILLGLEEASIYSVYSVVFNGINVLCSSFSNAIYSAFGELISKNEQKTLQSSYDTYEYIYFIMISIVYSCTYILIMPFIKLYTANMNDVNYYLPILALLFIIVGVGNNLRIPANTIVTGAGHFRETKIYAIIEMIINLLAQIILGYFWGLYGVIFGSIISYIFRTIQFIYYANKKIIKRRSIISALRIIINVCTSVVICKIIEILRIIEINNYFEWVYNGFIIFFITAVLILFINFIFDRKAFSKCLSIIKSLI